MVAPSCSFRFLTQGLSVRSGVGQPVRPRDLPVYLPTLVTSTSHIQLCTMDAEAGTQMLKVIVD